VSRDTIDPQWLALAEEARLRLSNHYNGFKVGCIGRGEHGELFMAGNLKPVKDITPVCAEEFVMLQAEKAGIKLTHLIVAGVPREEDRTPTLHCCGERCRPAMRRRIREGGVISPDTGLVFHNHVSWWREEYTMASLMAFHGETLDQE
jgi:cytidine deaminase